MTRLIAVFVALLFAAGAVAAPLANAGGKSGTPPPGQTPSSSTAPKDAGKEPVKKKIDINSAAAEELMTLPGIGEAYSKKIIEGRPYKMKNQLVSRKIIPDATYKKIQEQIIAKQDTAKVAPPAPKK